MKNKLLILFTIIISLLIFIRPTHALTKDYQDKVSQYTNTEVKKDIINIYFFRGEGCPHCAKEEEFFKKLEKEYDNIKIYDFEVWNNEENSNILKEVKSSFKVTNNNVPFTVIGTKYLTGYSDSTKDKIYEIIDNYTGKKTNSNNN